MLAMAATPLEAVATPQILRRTSVLLLTGGGRNPDVLGAFRRLVEREPRRLIVMCTRLGSPLAAVAATYPWVDIAEFDSPAGKDGFLATNSLLASAVLLVRSYAESLAAAMPLPDTLATLLGGNPDRVCVSLDRRCRRLWTRPNLIVLHGPETDAAAVDLESKMTEAALGAVQLADYRHFAHGRHHWLAKRGDDTGVLAISTRRDRELARRILSALPGRVPVVCLHARGAGIVANLAALIQMMMVTGSAGLARGIDPGDPGVPSFGRRIYHMRVFGVPSTSALAIPERERGAIERKSGSTIETLASQGRLSYWRTYYRSFAKRLIATHFRGLVLDYDGTLCDDSQRFGPLPRAVGAQLHRLLRSGTVLGIATGRGKSLKKSLRDALEERFWSRVVVGYYNGGDVGLLSDDTHPDGDERVAPALVAVLDALRRNPSIESLAEITPRCPQIALELRAPRLNDRLWGLVQNALCQCSPVGVTALRSTHSIDILAPGVCKRAVVARMKAILRVDTASPVLCVGDRGCWPGNDFSLLSGPYSLSVDEVSCEPDSCWNLATPGRRGEQATLELLGQLEAKRGTLRLTLD